MNCIEAAETRPDQPRLTLILNLPLGNVRSRGAGHRNSRALGGAYVAEAGAGLFVPHITNGGGFHCDSTCYAAARKVTLRCSALLFGVSLSLTTALQVAGINIPTDVVQMLPFAIVMLVFVIFGRDSVLPPALGLPYIRGERYDGCAAAGMA